MKYTINSTGAVIVADLDFVTQHYPGDFTEVQDVSPVVVDPCEWLIDIAPFTDRLEPYKFQIDTHTDPFIQYFNRDLSRRKYADLKDPRVAAALNYMAGHTIAGIGTIAAPIFNDAFVSGVLTTPVIQKENFALRKAYFS